MGEESFRDMSISQRVFREVAEKNTADRFSSCLVVGYGITNLNSISFTVPEPDALAGLRRAVFSDLKNGEHKTWFRKQVISHFNIFSKLSYLA